MKKNSVVIFDDHIIFIQGLTMLINAQKDFCVVGQAKTIFTAEKLVAQLKPDLAIVDLNLAEEDGLDLIKILSTQYPKMKLLVLSMLDEQYYAERSLAVGAHGYIMKEVAAETLTKAMRTVLSGKIWLSKQEQERCLNSLFQTKNRGFQPINPIETLSNRQLQIFRMIGKGLSTQEIAQKLFISTKTVDAHKDQLKKKLGCASTKCLLKLAISWNK